MIDSVSIQKMTHGTGREAGQEARFQRRLAACRKARSQVGSPAATNAQGDMETVHPSLGEGGNHMKPSRWPFNTERLSL
jgi:hypothetical protein